MGAHIARLVRTPISTLFYLVFLLSYSTITSGLTVTDALLKFKSSLQNTEALNNWDPATPPCGKGKPNWVGVNCVKGLVWGLQLENMNLQGTDINTAALASIPTFRSISLMNNSLAGPMPDLKILKGLRTVYLSNNAFSGAIPDDAFAGMRSLSRLFMAQNRFRGGIPSSLTKLPRLRELNFQGNEFQGRIPNFADTIKMLNVANNDLEGPIPETLEKLDPDFFAGNKNLCGVPLEPCNSPPPVQPPSQSNLIPSTLTPHETPPMSSKKLSGPIIFLIVIASLGALGACFALLLVVRKKQKSRVSPSAEMNDDMVIPSSGNQMEYKPPAKIKSRRTERLTFLADDRQPFDLQELLTASAEILGSGAFGSSYKAVLSSTNSLVVKRYKQMNMVAREDFHEHMRRLGRLTHPHLLPLVAYYFRKDEKLLVSDFVVNGSLASQLHCNRTRFHMPLSWPTRLRIIKGIGRGLAYLHQELRSLEIPHGHLKSSNVLLDSNNEPLLTDYGLLPAINQDHAQVLLVAFKSPEYAKEKKVTKKSDVWSLGVLILEVLTGKFPENYLKRRYDNQADIATWVNTAVKEKRTGEVFDKEMDGTKDRKSEMLKLLKIGLICCEEDEESRPDIKEVMEEIEQLKVDESSEDYNASTRSVHFGGVSFLHDA